MAERAGARWVWPCVIHRFRLLVVAFQVVVCQVIVYQVVVYQVVVHQVVVHQVVACQLHEEEAWWVWHPLNHCCFVVVSCNVKKFEAWQSEAEHSRLEILSYAASCLAGSWKYLLTPFPSYGGICVGFSNMCFLYFLFLFSIAMVLAILFLDALFLYGLSNKAECYLLFFSLFVVMRCFLGVDEGVQT